MFIQSDIVQLLTSVQVGIVENYTVDDWKADIVQAQSIGIDGFALNCAPPRVDNYTPRQLANAYEAAGQLGFHVFVSFDFAYWSNGDTDEITSILGNYSAHPAQAYYNGGALASTFVGDNFNWNAVKSALAPQKIFPVPMLQDPNFLGTANTGLDGALSWYGWPTDGGNSVIKGPMTTIWDDRYLANKKDRIYMAREFIITCVACSILTCWKRCRLGFPLISIRRTGSSFVRNNLLFAGNRCFK